MKHPIVAAITVVVAIGLVVGAVLLSRPQKVWTLVADTPVPIYDVAVSDPALSKVLATMNVGDAATITGCVDLKHCIAPKVQLRNGITGYVIDGRFHLRSESGGGSSDRASDIGC